MRFYALVSNQGTACAETTLREDNYNDHMRSHIERAIDTSNPDAPIAGSWTDVTGNEACEAMYDGLETKDMEVCSMSREKESMTKPIEWTDYDAVAACEGFDGEEHNEEELISAWQHLIDTGLCWSLQGWFGRTAHALIKQGVCHERRP